MAAIKRVDHIALAVRNVDKSIAVFQKLFGAKLITKKRGMVQGHLMSMAYMQVGESVFVLDEAVDPEGFIATFIEKRGEGLHHLGLEVDNLDEYVQELESKGVPIRVKSLDGELRREILLGPREANGVVCQVIEWKGGADVSLEERIERVRQYREVDEENPED
ncbi:VOC family protein [Thermodesulfobacteriota bacterium]